VTAFRAIVFRFQDFTEDFQTSKRLSPGRRNAVGEKQLLPILFGTCIVPRIVVEGGDRCNGQDGRATSALAGRSKLGSNGELYAAILSAGHITSKVGKLKLLAKGLGVSEDELT